MSDEKFDAIIVGGGLAGSSAAYTLAKAGLEVLVVERGNECGSKNVSGGRLYGHSMEKLIPGFAETAPIERKIVKERIALMTETGATTIEYASENLNDSSCASYSVLRAKFDKWLAEQAEAEGAMYITGIRVDKLLQKNGTVCGVIAGEDVLEADVVILADGVNSPLAQKIGMKKELQPHQVAVGVKEIIELDEKVIEERFGLNEGEGTACLVSGYPSGGAVGGGFLYTNKNSVSIGTVVTIGQIGSGENIKVPDMIERFKSHSVIAPLIKGGKTIEYSAHLVSEGGFSMMPELYWNGVLIAGDAAAFVINMGYTFRGMDFAIESGRLAAQTVMLAKEKNDFSAEGLSDYIDFLENSFVMKDMRHYRNMPALMDNEQIYNEIPELADKILSELFIFDGSDPTKLTKTIPSAVKQSGSLIDYAKLLTRAATTL